QPTVRSNVTDPVEFNDTVSLTCTASGSDVSYRWFNGSSVVSDSERIHLSDDNKTLTIPGVLRSDDGTLYCYVFNPVSNSTSEPFHLIVSYGPEEASIMAPDLAANGSAITLTCSAHSQPPSHYTWYLNGKQTANGSQYMIDHVSADNEGNYTCVAWNSVTGRNSSAIKELTVIAPIANINVKPTPAQPIENNTFSLTCNVTGTADSRLWWKDDQPLSTTERITLSGDNSTVSFNPVLQSDNGTYQCTASDPVSQLNSTGYRLDVNCKYKKGIESFFAYQI
ncbi:carcinoembryonic antigen-related cell adhesion molecule 5-like, partial [Acipenser oxyrinchus oxyrinchus]